MKNIEINISPINRTDVFDVANRGPIKTDIIQPKNVDPEESEARKKFIENMNV